MEKSRNKLLEMVICKNALGLVCDRNNMIVQEKL